MSLKKRDSATSAAHERVLRSELVAVTFLLTFTLGRFNADLLVVLLQSSEIFTRFREFSLFHSFSDVPMNEGTLRVHEIELMVDTGEHLSNSCGVADHADGAHN